MVPRVWQAASGFMWANIFFAGRGLGQLDGCRCVHGLSEPQHQKGEAREQGGEGEHEAHENVRWRIGRQERAGEPALSRLPPLPLLD